VVGWPETICGRKVYGRAYRTSRSLRPGISRRLSEYVLSIPIAGLRKFDSAAPLVLSSLVLYLCFITYP
jgi:hypothetical protein